MSECVYANANTIVTAEANAASGSLHVLSGVNVKFSMI